MFKCLGVNRASFDTSLTFQRDWPESGGVKISDKGQVTIPSDVRRKHGLIGRAEVELIDHPDGVLVVKAGKLATGKQVLKELLHGEPITGTTRQLLRLTRGS